MKRVIWLQGISLALVVILSFGAVEAASLWSDSSSASNLYGDRRAHGVGDIITIIISETSTATRSGSTANSKSASGNANAGTGPLTFIPPTSYGTSDSTKTSGNITNTNRVTGTITVTVTEVLPNGNMLVNGTQTIKQNGEEQKITVNGTIRPEDITPNNTINSNYVANASIKIDGKGAIANKQRQGILSQIWDFVF